jgi:hypothetical protein
MNSKDKEVVLIFALLYGLDMLPVFMLQHELGTIVFVIDDDMVVLRTFLKVVMKNLIKKIILVVIV